MNPLRFVVWTIGAVPHFDKGLGDWQLEWGCLVVSFHFLPQRFFRGSGQWEKSRVCHRADHFIVPV